MALRGEGTQEERTALSEAQPHESGRCNFTCQDGVRKEKWEVKVGKKARL